MIQGNVNAVFPGNAVLLIQERLSGIDPDIPVFRRPLQPTDPVQCMSVFSTLWTPRQDSVELAGVTIHQECYADAPELQHYSASSGSGYGH
jgi:hypothetical protein